MTESWKNEEWAKDFWYRGKVTRRRLIGLSAAAAGALGASMLVPAPWRSAFGQAKPYKLGMLQPLSGTAAAGGKTALVGGQMAVDGKVPVSNTVSEAVEATGANASIIYVPAPLNATDAGT